MEAVAALADLGIAAGEGSSVLARVPTQRLTATSLTYDQIVDEVLLSPPTETQGALAKRLGYTQSWLSRLISSDAFQVKLAERIEKHIEPDRREAFRLRFATIEAESRAILLGSLQKLSTRLADPAGVPDELLIKSASMTSKLLGYGARAEPTAPQRVDMHLHLHQLATNLRNLNQAPNISDAVVATQPAVSAE